MTFTSGLRALNFLSSLALAAIFLGAVSASSVTIISFSLKSADERWVTVIEPDRVVDPARDELSVGLFNNGRVPAGRYANFRLEILKPSGRKVQISATRDFDQPFDVKKGSFLAASCNADATAEKILSVTLVCDGREVALKEEQIQMEAP